MLVCQWSRSPQRGRPIAEQVLRATNHLQRETLSEVVQLPGCSSSSSSSSSSTLSCSGHWSSEVMAGTDLLLLLLGATALLGGTAAQRSRVRRQNMKVRINATGDTIVMKFVRPSPDVKLEGYILGYGSSVFSKQFIQLPENGRTYETEIDAEPKYLVAVQPIPVNDVKKHCTGKVNLEKPLHLVIGSVSPTAVLLSWGNYLKTPYEGNIMNECLEDGFYTIRYRERNRKWNYQTCPTSDTVIDNLKPNTPYEFGVRSNKDERSGSWSKPVIHNTNMGNKNSQKTFKMRNTLAKPVKPPGAHALFPPRPALHNRTQPRLPPPFKKPGLTGVSRTPFAFGKSQDRLPLLRTALTSQRANSDSWGQSRNLNPAAPKSFRPAPGNSDYSLSNGFRHRPSNSSPNSRTMGGNRPCLLSLQNFLHKQSYNWLLKQCFISRGKRVRLNQFLFTFVLLNAHHR